VQYHRLRTGRPRFDAIDALHRNRESLAERDDRGGERGGQVIEIGKVLFGYDQGVRRPDRMDVEEREQLLVLVDDMRADFARRHAAEMAIISHGASIGSAWMSRLAP
jgi:hypothetical protein